MSRKQLADQDTRISLRVERSAQGLERLGGWVDEIAADLALTGTTEYALRLCLEEAVANIVMHGVPVPGIDAGLVSLAVGWVADRLHLTVTDRCAGFDPRTAPPMAVGSGINGQVGGFGIHLMRQFAQDIAYARDGDDNRLTMTIRA